MIKIAESSFGKLSSGKEAKLFQIKNSHGNVVELTNYGARIVSWIVPDKEKKDVDIVLGYPSVSGYETDTNYMGATIGRNANRIANSEFTLGGKTYKLFENNGKNSLHGGKEGFDRKIWDYKILENGVKFSYTSPNGEENYPGELRVSVIFTLDETNHLSIEYNAVCDKKTVCNLTNHAYFNLTGANSNSLKGETIQIFADKFTWANPESLPDGRLVDVSNTPMDLRVSKEILQEIDADYDQLQFAYGYDHNWCINGEDGKLKLAASVMSPHTHIKMTVMTDMPGIQFYAGNFLSANTKGKGDVEYKRRSGFALETQYFPNAINIPAFKQPILEKGEIFSSKTIYRAFVE